MCDVLCDVCVQCTPLHEAFNRIISIMMQCDGVLHTV